ncbi:MAG: hypothetical protein HKM02_05165, partial [Pseudomonadales bacterium]|nr:hypothetical protein [Pseudomonadales bacterium]
MRLLVLCTAMMFISACSTPQGIVPAPLALPRRNVQVSTTTLAPKTTGLATPTSPMEITPLPPAAD